MADLGPPFLPIPGIANFRDLASPPLIKPGLIYRSAEPSRLTDAGVALLQDLRITHVFDLRSDTEIRAHGAVVREWPRCERVFAPIFKDEDFSPEAIAVRFQNYMSDNGTEGFVEAYRTILATGTKPFGAILSHLAKPDASPMLIHCTAGKDRTGVICAIILSLCGVEDEHIAQEYGLTELGLAEKRQEITDSLMRNLALADDRAAAERMLGSRPESMLAALQMLRREYGSAEQYALNHCGLSPEDVAQIQKNLVVASEQ